MPPSSSIINKLQLPNCVTSHVCRMKEWIEKKRFHFEDRIIELCFMFINKGETLRFISCNGSIYLID